MIFSEKETKITPQTHIKKFEILEIDDFTDIDWEMKNFKISDVSLGSDFCFFSQEKSPVSARITFVWYL